MTTEMAKRVENFSGVDCSIPCYWKNETTGHWYLYLPHCGAGALSGHTIALHRDGTISVTPSILMTGHRDGEWIQRHGYLTRGVWEEC